MDPTSCRSAVAGRLLRSNLTVAWLLVLIAGFSAADSDGGGKGFAAVRAAEGVTEVVLLEGDAVASELIAKHDGRELRLLQVANGTRVAVLILGVEGDELLDCDVSSPAKAAELRRHVAERLSGGSGFTAARLSAATRRSLTAVDDWIDACRAFHERQLRALEDGTYGGGNDYHHRYGDNSSSWRAPRGKRSMIPLVYPGTKWCGRGNRAVAYDDLGERRIADSCCRVHDHCPKVIQPMTTKFNYFNYRLYTVSHCDCDQMLHKCLKRAIRKHSDSVSQMIGHLFFNVVAMPCFVLEEQDVCAERSWWGTCVRTEKLTKARIANETKRF